ncbi:aspartate aminotransferase family protein, partial [Pseudomonas syringae pv. tagetis]
MSANNPQTLEWQALSSEHHLAPFSDYNQLKEKGPRIISRAVGVFLWDCEGNMILDGMSGL